MLVNRSAPPGTIVPTLVYDDLSQAIPWLCQTFGFRERLRWVDQAGVPEGAELEIGEGSVMLSRTRPGRRQPQGEDVSQTVMVQVEDVDAHYNNAKQRGADVRSEPATHAFGERQYGVRDLAGHHWTFTQSVADVAPEDWGAITPDEHAR
jgi:uncharacterized glyoxalase superfamily protein PhnB